MRLPEQTRRLLRAALTRRAEEVRAWSGPLPTSRGCPRPGDEALAEDVLRRVMVRYYPRVAAGHETRAERARYLDLLRTLEDLAAGDDLRFLDAYNNAWEALSRAGELDAECAEFASAYLRVLDRQHERLR